MPIVRLDGLEQFQAINVLSDPGHIGGPIVIPNCIQVNFGWGTASGKIAFNVLHGQVGTFTPTVAIADAIKTALTTGAAWTTLAAFFASTSAFAFVQLRDLRTANNPIIGSTPGNVPGTSASPELPDEVALVITLRTAKTGPGNRGRIYVPAWATNALGTGNVVIAAAVTALGAWANTIPGAFTASGLTLAIGQPARQAYTGKTGTQHPARAAGTTVVSSQTVRDNHWDTVRRRGLK